MMHEREPAVSPFVVASADALNRRLADMFALSELELPQQVAIEVCDGVDAANQFPAASNWRRDGSLKLCYNEEAITDMAQRYSDDPEVFGHIERLYLLGGITLGILSRRLEDLDAKKITLLHAVLRSPDDLLINVSNDGLLTKNQITDLACSIMSPYEQRMLRIGVMRFTTGIAQVIQEESPGVHMLADFARRDLTDALNAKWKTRALLEAMNIDKTDAHDRADAAFREQVPEFTLALCYPMDFEELRRIFQIVTAKNQQNDSCFDELVVQEMPDDGYHEIPTEDPDL